jgi:hypothetical protein
MSTAQTRYSEAKGQAAAAREVMKDTLKEALAEGLAAFFAEHPDEKAVAWTQYTPSFNDGDPCTFQLNEYGGPTDDDDSDDDEVQNHKDACDILRDFDEDSMELAFGDGYSVYVKRATTAADIEFKVSDYDCGY